MQTKPNTHYFLITLLLLSLLLIYFITQPFLGALLLAAIFSYLFQPIYQKIKKWNKVGESGSAFITTILSIAVVIAPLIFLGIQIFNESTSLYRSLIANSGAGIIGLIEQTINQFQSNLPIETKFEFNVSEYIKQTLDIVIQNLGSLFTSLAQIILNTFVFLTAFYFFLKDGNKLKSYIIELSPLTLKENNLILSRLATSVSAAVKGNVIIGIIQGILTGIGFALFGVPNAVLWGGVAAIAAFIPGIGTALVITPGILFLFLTGNTFEGIGLLLWGISAVGLVDNLLGPRLVGRGMQLHPLAVFIAVLGGMSFFGPLGFLLGPLALSLCIALIDIYRSFHHVKV